MKKNPNIAMLELVAQGLGELREEVVFVGGTTTIFYITDLGAADIRPTNDVDCIVEIGSMGDYYKFEKKLRNVGFKHDSKGGRLICRWDYKGTTVDVMPTDENILGFSNQWYLDGIKNRIQVSLPSNTEIYILPMRYFIATKIEAYHGRGQKDLRTSHDIEDIITVIDGNTNVENDLKMQEGKLKEYLQKSFKEILADSNFDEAVRAHLPFGPDKDVRVGRIEKILKTQIEN